jgi:small subunit ribosomal protein S20
LAQHKSAEKRSRQGEKRHLYNAAVKSKIRTEMKRVLSAVEAKDAEGAQAALTTAVPMIAKAGSRGVHHKKNASRKISRLTRNVNALKGK